MSRRPDGARHLASERTRVGRAADACAEGGRLHVMSLGEMSQANRLRATEAEPAHIGELRRAAPALYVESHGEPEITVTRERLTAGEGKSVWRVGLCSPGGSALPGMPVLRADRVHVSELVASGSRAATAGFRPPWVDLEYLPRLAPYRVAGRHRPSEAGCGGMRLLTTHTQEQLSTDFPWRCIGKVFTGDATGWTSGGTGVLVGPNLMMTASHVWPWDVPGRWMLFSPGFRDGRQHPDSFVTRVLGVRPDDGPSGFDYVICQLQKPLGEMLGWMGSQSFAEEEDYYAPRWISVGYPSWFFNGTRPAAEFGIDIDDIDDDDPGLELETNFDDANGGGWSGGPLWGFIDNDPRVIGIKSGWEWDVYDPARGVFAGGTLMVDLIKHGLANFR
jgi:hypothetical protein